MWSKRAFVHWVVGVGLSDDSVHEARESVESYIKDFQQFLPAYDGSQEDQELILN